MRLLGDLLATGAWAAIALVIRHERRAQRRDGLGWKGPGW